MKTTDLNQLEKNKKNIAFASFATTKRIQWDKYRRYGVFVS
ncbi:MAG TPA: hypothetical protein VIO43_09405 [Lutibacter sp.]